MPDPTSGKPPLEAFLEQYWKDQEAGRERDLREYLGMFPGDEQGVAREYFSLVGGREQRGESATTGAADRLGPYHLLRELGRGGQAIVYLAEDTRLRDRKVAVKVLTGGSSLLSQGALERFRREAEVASKLEHPGICPVYDAGVDEARPYIAMRYIEGNSLAQQIRSSQEVSATTDDTSLVVSLEMVSIPESGVEAPTDATPTPSGPATRTQVMRAVWLIERAARALHVAHEACVIHRDIKPANIMVGKDGQPVLMDFGLAKEVEAPTLTMTGDFFGTPAYMSPEQLLAQRVSLDRRTDVWSLVNVRPTHPPSSPRGGGAIGVCRAHPWARRGSLCGRGA